MYLLPQHSLLLQSNTHTLSKVQVQSQFKCIKLLLLGMQTALPHKMSNTFTSAALNEESQAERHKLQSMQETRPIAQLLGHHSLLLSADSCA